MPVRRFSLGGEGVRQGAGERPVGRDRGAAPVQGQRVQPPAAGVPGEALQAAVGADGGVADEPMFHHTAECPAA